MIEPTPIVAKMQAFPLADMSAPAGKRVIRLAQNESAFPPSPRAVAAAQDALNDPTAYPDPGWGALRRRQVLHHPVPKVVFWGRFRALSDP